MVVALRSRRQRKQGAMASKGFSWGTTPIFFKSVLLFEKTEEKRLSCFNPSYTDEEEKKEEEGRG